MSRKLLIILSVVVLICILIVGWAFFLVRSEPKADESSFTKKVREIFPFGKPTRDPDTLFTGDDFNDTNNPDQNPLNKESSIPKLRKIYEYPVSGSLVWSQINNKKETEVFIRFVDRATGHVLETTPTSLNNIKISNTTLTKVYEAIFASNQLFVGRFLDSVNDELIKTFSISLKDKSVPITASSTISQTNTAAKESIGTSLDEQIREISVSPRGDKVAYVLYENDGGSIIISNSNGTNKRKLYTSALREWLIEWVKEDAITLSTKPSGFSFGYAYVLNPITGALSKVVGDIAGLTIKANNDHSQYLVGQGGDSLSLFSLKKGGVKEQSLFLAKTLPEKCAWSKKEVSIIYCAIPSAIANSVYPDYWYQGRISFDDTVWKINTQTATTNLISIPVRDGGENIDATNIQIASDDSYLTFINKKDLSLWGLTLIEKQVVVDVATTTASSTLPR